MPKKKVITLNEFKVVIEDIKTDIRKVTEVMQAEFKIVKSDIRTIKEQIALLHEGQTEIKNNLKQKVDRDEFARLEMRVAKLENRAA